MKKVEKKVESEIVSIVLLCGSCNTTSIYALLDVSIGSQEDECGLCGSHGKVDVDATCKLCNKDINIIIREW